MTSQQLHLYKQRHHYIWGSYHYELTLTKDPYYYFHYTNPTATATTPTLHILLFKLVALCHWRCAHRRYCPCHCCPCRPRPYRHCRPHSCLLHYRFHPCPCDHCGCRYRPCCPYHRCRTRPPPTWSLPWVLLRVIWAIEPRSLDGLVISSLRWEESHGVIHAHGQRQMRSRRWESLVLRGELLWVLEVTEVF